MPVKPDYLRTLEAYTGKYCKVVYRDGGVNSPPKAFYGRLVDFDEKFQVWAGKNDPSAKESYRVDFNHNDVSRIVMEIGGINA
jgi:hypothetical protein